MLDLMGFSAIAHDVFVYVLRLALVLAGVLIGWQLASLAQRATLRGMDRGGIDVTIGRFVANLLRVGLLALMAIAALGALGVETSAFSAAIAGASVAIGLSFRDTLANVAAGFMLLLFRPFRVGDFVNVAGVSGKVFEIDLFITKLDTADNRRLVLPNGTVFRANIENTTHHPQRRVDVVVQVSSNDPEKVRAILQEAVKPHALPEPAPIAQLTRLAAPSDWSLRFWCNGADYDEVRHKALASVAVALAAGGLPLVPPPAAPVPPPPGA
jgi:small conductance mechanosensitive channel